MSQSHFRGLQQMYVRGEINKLFPATMTVTERQATVELEVRPNFCHGLGAMHGAVYFKLLDDSACFAVYSIDEEVVYVTANFTVNFVKPVNRGLVKAIGRITQIDGKKIYAESSVYDADGNVVAHGSGLFLPTPMRFADIDDYQRRTMA